MKDPVIINIIISSGKNAKGTVPFFEIRNTRGKPKVSYGELLDLCASSKTSSSQTQEDEIIAKKIRIREDWLLKRHPSFNKARRKVFQS